MNKERFQAALNYIGDDLIAEAADCKPSKARPRPAVKFARVFACAAAALAVTVGLTVWSKISFSGASLENPSSAGDAISDIISGADPSSKEPPDYSAVFSYGDEKGVPTLEEWKKFSGVVWNTNNETLDITSPNAQNGIDPRSVELGTVRISEELSKLVTAEPYAMYAVRVDFEPCRSEEEMNARKYLGVTVGQIKKTLESPLNSDAEKHYSELLDAASYDYYLSKLRKFNDTFKSQNHEIYPVEQGSTDDYSWFYCFIGGDRLKEFVCKSDEAFIFYLADR